MSGASHEDLRHETPFFSRDARAKGGRTFSLVVGVACVALAVEVLVLARENRRLRAAFEANVAHAAAPAPRELLAAGDFVGDFEVRDADGGVRPVAFDGTYERTLLLVFTSDCTGCSMVRPDWEAVLGRLPAGTRVVAIQLDRFEGASAGEELLSVPIRTHVEGEALPLAKLTTVPVTAVLDLAGFVAWVRYGSMDPTALAALEHALATGEG